MTDFNSNIPQKHQHQGYVNPAYVENSVASRGDGAYVVKVDLRSEAESQVDKFKGFSDKVQDIFLVHVLNSSL